MTGTAIAGVIGGPLSSAPLLLDGVGGLQGWQFLFIFEGLPAVILAPIVWRRLDKPTVIGYMRDVTGSFSAGLWLLAGCLTAGAAVAMLLPAPADVPLRGTHQGQPGIDRNRFTLEPRHSS